MTTTTPFTPEWLGELIGGLVWRIMVIAVTGGVGFVLRLALQAIGVLS